MVLTTFIHTKKFSHLYIIVEVKGVFQKVIFFHNHGYSCLMIFYDNIAGAGTPFFVPENLNKVVSQGR